MKKTIIVKRIGYDDITLKLGRHESKWEDGDIEISANVAGLNLPFEVKGYLNVEGEFKDIAINWSLWRGNKNFSCTDVAYLRITGGLYPCQTEHPAPTPAQATTVRRWQDDPSSRPFPTMSGPNKKLLEWAGISDEPKPLQENDQDDPTIYSLQGEIELPLMVQKMKRDKWAAKIQITLHDNITRVWAYVDNGNIFFSDVHHNGNGFEKACEPSVDLLQKNSLTAGHYDRQAILSLVRKLNATIKPALFEWLNVEPRRQYSGPEGEIILLDSDMSQGSPDSFRNRCKEIRRIFAKDATAGYGFSGPYVLVIAVVDGYWYLAGKTVNAKRGSDFTIIGEIQIRLFLTKRGGKFVTSALKHMEEVGKSLLVSMA